MPPEVWKYAGPHQTRVRDGRTVWTDAVFFLSPENVRERMARPPAGIERLSVSEQRQLRDLLARAAGRRSPA